MYHEHATCTLLWNTHHFSTEWIIKSLKQLNNRALSTATATNKSQSFSFFYIDVQTSEHFGLWSGWVVKCHVIECYISTKYFLIETVELDQFFMLM